LKEICNTDVCCGCGCCIAVCSAEAIHMKNNELDTPVPVIDADKCIECNLCKKVCPECVNVIDYRLPIHSYAAWSSCEQTRASGASGGIASEIYKFAIKEQIFIMGTCFDRDIGGVCFKEVISEDDIKWTRDSKYVYSDMKGVYQAYKEKLINGKNCIFIGLPCQVFALKRYLELWEISQKNLLTVDLICHGVPDFDYLNQHLCGLEKRKKEKIAFVSFRDSQRGYLLNCRGKDGNTVYKRGMHENDRYYRAFALNLNFREGCYNCKFSRNKRVSDITLGDYSGLGRKYEFAYSRSKVSCVLSMSVKGESFLQSLKENGNIFIVDRPYDEIYEAEGNPNLRHPSIPYKTRNVFVKEYKRTKNYDKAVGKALRILLIKWWIQYPRYILGMGISRIIPGTVKVYLKRMIRR